MAQLPLGPWDTIKTLWKSILDPIAANPLLNSNFIQNQSLINGSTAVNHGLGRTPKGWFLVAPQGAASVYQSASQPNPTLTLTLTSNAAIKTGIVVF